MTRPTRSRIDSPADFQREFRVSRETRARLEMFSEVLRKWQPTINLVAPGSLPDLWHRHIADSAQLVSLAPPEPVTWLDLGSGGGFPGLVVAVLLAERAPSARVILVESDSRKAAFLREAARLSGVAVDILVERIEQIATRGTMKSVDVVSARALAPLPRLLELVHPFTGPHTVLLAPKGRDLAAELQAVDNHWTFDAQAVESLTDPDGRILVLRGLQPAR